MACYSPKYILKVDEDDIEEYYRLKAFVEFHHGNVTADKYFLSREQFDWLNQRRPDIAKHVKAVGCGQCIGCRLNRSRIWADRCVLEAMEYPEVLNWCITLTYSDDALRYRDAEGKLLHPLAMQRLDCETGELDVVLSLYKRDIQLFMKRFRRIMANFGYTNIRYFVAGEYGDKNGRPHFHLILFNVGFPDLKRHSMCYSPNGDTFESELLNRAWSDNFGTNFEPDYHLIGLAAINRFSWSFAAYIARYILKKQTGVSKKEFLQRYQFMDPETGAPTRFEDEFTLCSTHPGIAYNYYQLNKDRIYDTDAVFVRIGKKVETRKPFPYFDKLFERENPERLQELKEIRQGVAIAGRKLELEQTTLDEEAYLAQCEQARIRSLQKRIRTL